MKYLVLLFLLISLPALAQSNVKISAMPSGGNLQTTDLIPIVRSGNNYSVLGSVFNTTSFSNLIAPVYIGTSGFIDTGVGLQDTGNINSYYQEILQNTNSGTSASADYIVGGNDMTSSLHYADFGKNGANGGLFPFANSDAAYSYTVDNEFDIGALGTSGNINFAIGSVPTTIMKINASGVFIPSISGSTQCLQVNSSGLISGTSSACSANTVSVGTTSVSGGTNGGLLYNNSGVVGSLTSIGTSYLPIGTSGATLGLLNANLTFGGNDTFSNTIAGNISGTAANITATSNTTLTSLSNLATVGTITSGTWNASVVAGQYGGTGVANTGKTITLGGNLTTSGAFASTFNMTGTTNVTFPTSGTLATVSGALTPSSVASSGAVSGTTANFTGAAAFGSAAQATIDTSGNIQTTGNISDISTTGNAVLVAQGHEQSGGGALLKLRDDTMGIFGYVGQNSVIQGGTSYNQLTITNPQTSGTVCIASNGGGSATANTNCDLLDDATGVINIRGTKTNNAAAAGYVGEMIESTLAAGSAISLATNTQTTITSISLTAGDWDVRGVVDYVSSTGTNYLAAINTVASFPVAPAGNSYSGITFATAAPSPFLSVGPTRILLSTTTTVYLMAYCTFGTSCSAYGYIGARRMR